MLLLHHILCVSVSLGTCHSLSTAEVSNSLFFVALGSVVGSIVLEFLDEVRLVINRLQQFRLSFVKLVQTLVDRAVQ